MSSSKGYQKLGYLLLVMLILSARIAEAATYWSAGVFIGFAVMGLIGDIYVRNHYHLHRRKKIGSVNIINNFSKPVAVNCVGKTKGHTNKFSMSDYTYLDVGSNYAWSFRDSVPAQVQCNIKWEHMSHNLVSRSFELFGPNGRKLPCYPACQWSFENGRLFVDSLFLYVPTVANPQSLYMDWHIAGTIAMLRSVPDLIFLCRIVSMVYVTPSPRVTKREELIKESNYKKPSLIIDLIAILPIPQITVFLGLKNQESNVMARCVFVQLPFKVLAMSPLSNRTAKKTSILAKNAWSGALQNLMYFIMISNGVGAIYYNAYISELLLCKNDINATDSDAATLDWDELINRCTKNYDFEYGMLSDAFTTKIGTRSFIQKYTFCLAWGLKSLSSFGQIFSASSFALDTFYSFLIIVFGLVLFGDLLARMQTGLQCTEQKEDQQRARQRMVEEWTKYHQLPPHLNKQVKQAIQSEWSATRGLNDEAILESLPWDIRSEIRRHLYLEIVCTLPIFKRMDVQLAKAICGYLRTFSSNAGTYVAFEGEPVRQMLFIFSGQLEVSKANNGGQCIILGQGDLCGKELLEWCSYPTTSTESLQPSTQTIKCRTDVDAFALQIDEVKLLAIQFHRDGTFRRAFQRFAA